MMVVIKKVVEKKERKQQIYLQDLEHDIIARGQKRRRKC